MKVRRLDAAPAPFGIHVCLITGFDNSSETEKAVTLLLDSGIRWVQYRGKNRTRKELFYSALKLRELVKGYGACLVVNDYVDVALAVDADGVHLGQDDLPLEEARKIMGDRIIGISAHNASEALEAQSGGADYIGFGPIFHTTTKDAGMPRGIADMTEVMGSVDIPVIAIGGITADNLKGVAESGCAGVAVSAGLLKGNVGENAERFLAVLQDIRMQREGPEKLL